MEPWRILLVDDHTLFRQGITSLLASYPEMEVVGSAADGLEALALAREARNRTHARPLAVRARARCRDRHGRCRAGDKEMRRGRARRRRRFHAPHARTRERKIRP